jgi:LysM repeat protein
LKVPTGTAASVRTRLASADPGLFVRFEQHTVRRGETLGAIARKYGLSVADLMQANQMRSTRLSINQTLILPTRPASGLPSTVSSTARASAPRTTSRPTTYSVRRGDTLIGIAQRFATTVSEIKRLNNLSSDRIVVGARLTVRR